MQDQEIDLKELWQIIDDNKKTIAKVTAGFLAVAAAYLIVVPPTYQSTSLLRIKQDKGLSSSILSALPTGSDQMIKQEMNTDAEILKSRNVVIPVIKQTEELKDGKYPDYEGYVKSRITTKPFKDTQILEVDVTGKTPEKAQEANSLLLKGFLNRLTELSRAESQATRKFLEQRVVSSKTELAGAEDRLKAYQVAHKIYSTTDQMKGLADQLTGTGQSESPEPAGSGNRPGSSGKHQRAALRCRSRDCRQSGHPAVQDTAGPAGSNQSILHRQIHR